MEVAETVVVMNEGRIEQIAPPRELYENPANEFVMTFVGQANRLNGVYVRPHDLRIVEAPGEDTIDAIVERIVPLGFDTRIEVRLPDGDEAFVQATREAADEWALQPGQLVHLCTARRHAFA